MSNFEISAQALHDLDIAFVSLGGGPAGPNEIRFRCPAHDDENPSARYHRVKQVWICDACGAGGGVADLCERLGIENVRSGPTFPARRLAGTYDYTNSEGKTLFQVLRYEPKDFSQRRPEGLGWVPKLDGVERVLYKLPAVLQAANAGDRVYVVEGEKDADALDALGLRATTSPQGAGKWRPEYAESLAGAQVVVIPDKDEPGRRHAEQVARSCDGKAQTVRVLDLPNPAAKDVSDWLSLGGTATKLEALADAAAIWRPVAEPTAIDDHDDLTISAADFAGLDIPAPPWLIKDIWKSQAVGFIAGPPKAFKSFLALDLAFAVASGQDFLDRFPPGERRARSVLLVQNESSKGAFQERVKAASKRFKGFPPTLRFITNVPIVLEDKSCVRRIEVALAKFRPELLILDPLASFTTGDENSAQEMGSVIRLVRGWRDRFGCAIGIVHHSGKTGEKGGAKRSGEKMRGSSALHGAVESALYVERVDDETPRITVRVEQKESEPTRPFVCEFLSESCQLTITAEVFQTDEKIRDAVRASCGATVAQIVQRLPKGAATTAYVRDRLRSMRGIRAEAGRGNKPTVYFADPDSPTHPG